MRTHSPLGPTPFLDHLLKGLVLTFVMAVAGFAAYYTWDRRPQAGTELMDRVIQQAEQAVRGAPNDAAARLTLADLLLARERPAEAMAQYQAALQIDGQLVRARQGLGLAYLEQGQLPLAEIELRQVIEARKDGEFAHVDKELQATYYFMAQIQAKQNQPERALESLNSALTIDRTDADSWELLSSVQLTLGQPEAAVQSATRAARLVPKYPEAYRVLARAYQAAGDPVGARYAAAMAHYADGAFDQALPELLAVTRAKPDFWPAWTGLGLVQEARVDKVAATAAFERALAGDPEDFNARAGLLRLGAARP